MAAYAYYSQNYYSDAIAELDRFLRVYPKHKDLAYAEYLLAYLIMNKLWMKKI